MRYAEVEPGTRFGRLVVVERRPSRNGRRYLCRCDCGMECEPRAVAIRGGHTVSCGCLRREIAVNRARAFLSVHNTKMGLADAPEYQAIRAARARCRNPRTPNYKNYGGRGIEYCFPENLTEAVALLITVIGRRPERMSLDRIDNDGPYAVGNVRWATASEQRANQRVHLATGPSPS